MSRAKGTRTLPAVIDAYAAFCREVSRRRLDVPDAVRDDLQYTLRQPAKAEEELFSRLLEGCRVLDSRGGDSAPASLWAHFEALLIAWQCADAANVARQQKARRRNRKETLPKVSAPLPRFHVGAFVTRDS